VGIYRREIASQSIKQLRHDVAQTSSFISPR
jgi:hypothetical protein